MWFAQWIFVGKQGFTRTKIWILIPTEYDDVMTWLFVGNPPITCRFHSQRASNAEPLLCFLWYYPKLIVLVWSYWKNIPVAGDLRLHDDCENICTSSYHHNQIGNMNPSLFLGLETNGMRCMFFGWYNVFVMENVPVLDKRDIIIY